MVAESESTKEEISDRHDKDFDIVDLICFLRGSELHIGTNEALRVVRLFEKIESLGQEPSSPDELFFWLAPLLCRSKQQQSILKRQLQAYNPVPQYEGRIPVRLINQNVRNRNSKAFYIILVVVFIMLAASFFLIDSKSNNFQTPAAEQAPSTQGVEREEPTDRPDGSAHRTKFFKFWYENSETVSLAVLGGMVPLSWWIVLAELRRRRFAKLERRLSNAGSDGLIQTEKPMRRLFSEESLSQALQGWRTYRRMPSRDIDLSHSLRLTVKRCGQPTFVHGWRPTLPSYPIIIHATSSRDHFVDLGHSLSTRLDQENISHELFFTNADPRWLRNESGSPAMLMDVAALFRQDVLVFVDDGEMLVDPVHGNVVDHLDLENWNTVVLLTPIPKVQWSWRERRIAQSGVLVLPATDEGLAIFGNFLRDEQLRLTSALDRAPAALSNLARWGHSNPELHQDEPPSSSQINRLLDEIAFEVSPNAFRLLAILALFPELRSDLTMFAADRLCGPEGHQLVTDKELISLFALPWLRVGRMPDWLRLSLVRTLNTESLSDARIILAEWMTPNSNDNGNGVTVNVDTFGDAALFHAAKNPQSELRDAIFLCFANRGDFSDLDVQAPPEAIERLSSKNTRFQFFGRTLTALASITTGLLAVVGGKYMNVTGEWWVDLTDYLFIALFGAFFIFATYLIAAPAFTRKTENFPGTVMTIAVAISQTLFLFCCIIGIKHSQTEQGTSYIFLMVGLLFPSLLQINPKRLSNAGFGDGDRSPYPSIVGLWIVASFVALIGYTGSEVLLILAPILFAFILRFELGIPTLAAVCGSYVGVFWCGMLLLFTGLIFSSLAVPGPETPPISSFVILLFIGLAFGAAVSLWRKYFAIIGFLAFVSASCFLIGYAFSEPNIPMGTIILLMYFSVPVWLKFPHILFDPRGWLGLIIFYVLGALTITLFAGSDEKNTLLLGVAILVSSWIAYGCRAWLFAVADGQRLGGALTATLRSYNIPERFIPEESLLTNMWKPVFRKASYASPPILRHGNITGQDYPSRSLRNEEQGKVTVELTVGENGRVTGYEVIQSSGYELLDKMTGKLIKRRFRYKPALDKMGTPTVGTTQQSVNWTIPDDEFIDDTFDDEAPLES